MKKIIFIILSLTFSLVNAQTLVKYGETTDGNFYYQIDTVQRNGNLVRVWEVVSFNKTQLDKKTGKNYKSIRGLYEYDCSRFMNRNLSETLTQESMGKGSVVFTQTVTFDWKYSEPGTPVYDLNKSLCN